MKPSKLVHTLLAFTVLALLPVFGSAKMLTPLDTPDPRLIPPKEVVNAYLEAVERGELVVFETVLTRDMIEPKRVEFVYELDNPIPIINVYSELKEPMQLEQHRDCEARGVSSSISIDGHIIETKLHIWPK